MVMMEEFSANVSAEPIERGTPLGWRDLPAERDLSSATPFDTPQRPHTHQAASKELLNVSLLRPAAGTCYRRAMTYVTTAWRTAPRLGRALYYLH